jgi:hypothetical protein
MRTKHWTTGIVLVALGIAAIGVRHLSRFYDYDKRCAAMSQAGSCVRACVAYRMKTLANGKYPARLLDLIEPPAGMQPLLSGGKEEIIDPWGKPFRYVIVETPNGPAPYVWTEFETKGELMLFGAKLDPSGKTVYFGQPDDCD